MPNLTQKPVNTSSLTAPRWVVALLCLQSLTLLAAFSAQNLLPTADAAQGRRDKIDQPPDRVDVLPNAADQRAEQIRLLREIAGELSTANASLERLNKQAELAAKAAAEKPQG